MKLDSFKELLLKKSEDNKNLQLLIKYMRDDYLLDHVLESLEKIESLEKMAAEKNANEVIKHFGTRFDAQTNDMIYDSLQFFRFYRINVFPHIPGLVTG